ncbi:MAG TPA: SIMPL domain-containing protein [Thermoanaerobaculia bacterium]|jgi:hypothetical protein
MKRFLFTLMVAAAATGALAQSASPTPRDFAVPETISVSGSGKATLVPDRFSFTVGVQTVGNTVDEAVNENNRRTAAVIAALKKAGAEERNIQTSNFNIWPQQDYQEGRLPRILGYQVSNSITVRSTKIGDAGRLLGIAINAGVNTSSGLNFEVSDPARGREQGLKAAYDDARAKATLLAQAAGRAVGRAITISEGLQAPPPMYPQMQRGMAMESKAAVSDVPVEAGSQELAYTVSVVFELR